MEKYPELFCERILAMEKEDLCLLERLQQSGELQKYGYHPALKKLHAQNGAALKEMISRCGFPTLKNAGAEVFSAAWRIVQHNIGDPAFMKSCFSLFGRYSYEEIPLKERAYLEDRIAFYERRPQRFGTQFDYDLNGNMTVWRLADRAETARLRALAGLPPLEEAEEAFRKTPSVPAERAREMREEQERWLEETGWCTKKDIEK